MNGFIDSINQKAIKSQPNSLHIAYNIPRYISFKKLTFMTIYNDFYNWSETRAYMAGKWKMYLVKNIDGKLILNKQRTGDYDD